MTLQEAKQQERKLWEEYTKACIECSKSELGKKVEEATRKWFAAKHIVEGLEALENQSNT